MTKDRFDVVGIGNAMVDVIAPCDAGFLAERNLKVGALRQIDTAASTELQGKLENAKRLAAGSAVNTVVGVRSLGGRSAFIGLVADDEMGRFFEGDLASANVKYERPRREAEKPTSHNIILVAPDGRRTINTLMGCSSGLGACDLDPDLIASARIVFLEGYLFDSETSRGVLHSALTMAKVAGRQVALGLSHRSIVDRHRNEILDLVRDGIDVLFGNELEITSLYETTSFGEAAHLAAQDAAVVALTRGHKGSYVVSKTRGIHVNPEPCSRIVDITGAGDLYAAGFLMALSEHNSMDLAARLGNVAAGAIIRQIGARPERSLAYLAHSKGLIAEPRPEHSELELFS